MVKHSVSATAAADRSFGQVLLAAVLFAAGLAGVAALWAVWPRASNTSPLAALFAIAWTCTYLAAAFLTWRGSRFAAPAFVGAMAFLLRILSFIFPGNWSLTASSCVVVIGVGLLGYRYLHRNVPLGSGRAL